MQNCDKAVDRPADQLSDHDLEAVVAGLSKDDGDGGSRRGRAGQYSPRTIGDTDMN